MTGFGERYRFGNSSIIRKIWYFLWSNFSVNEGGLLNWFFGLIKDDLQNVVLKFICGKCKWVVYFYGQKPQILYCFSIKWYWRNILICDLDHRNRLIPLDFCYVA